MKKYFIILLLLCTNNAILACPLCNKQIRDGIYNSTFYPNLLTILSAFIALAVIVTALIIVATKRHKARAIAYATAQLLSPVPLTATAIILGIGIGGFIDGIVLHQILQVHEMLSNKIPATNYLGKSINMFWDGVFHAFCLLIVVTGIILLWNLLRRKDIDISGKLLSGGLLTGWSLFNIVEGVIDHQLLKLHNVIEFATNHDWGNYSFLIISVIMLFIGYLIINQRVKSALTQINV